MAIKGKKLNQNLVMFGDPLNDKAKNALERSSPTANQIIQSLPPSAFIPMPEASEAEKTAKTEMVKEKVEKEKVLNAEEAKKSRIQKKKEAALKKRRERQSRKSPALEVKREVPIAAPIKNPEPNTIIEKIVENPKLETETKSMNLEEELKSLEESMAPKENLKVQEPVIQEEASAEMDLKDQILNLLEGEENPPSLDLISAWKESYGKNGIHVMAFGEGDVYVYHHLTRGEWKKIKELMNKMRESQNPEEVEEKLKEKVVMYCVLWPSLDERWLNYCKAGILDSLYQMILLNSGFLTPQQSMLLTTQL
jgi:hypothetical protein